MKKTMNLLIIFLFFSCAQSKLERQLVDFDDRVAVNAYDYPYSAIGMLESNKGLALGTGLVVHSRMILTAAHVVERLARGDTFRLETKESNKPLLFKIDRIYTPIDRPRRCADRDRTQSIKCFESDFAIVTLEENIPEDRGRFMMIDGWIDQYKDKRFELQSTGYGISSRDKNYMIMTKSKTPCEGYLEKRHNEESIYLIRHNCKSYPGDSGGPLYVMGDDDKAYVLSLAVGAINYLSYLQHQENPHGPDKSDFFSQLKKPVGDDDLLLGNFGLTLTSRHIDFVLKLRDSL